MRQFIILTAGQLGADCDPILNTCATRDKSIHLK